MGFLGMNKGCFEGGYCGFSVMVGAVVVGLWSQLYGGFVAVEGGFKLGGLL